MMASKCSAIRMVPRLAERAAVIARFVDEVSPATSFRLADWTSHRGFRPQAGPSDAAARDELGGDHVALDLVGAFADDHQGCVAEVSLDVVFA